jgi:hypothetical protein
VKLQERWLEAIQQMEVLDTHTHLVGERLAARNFWEIAHYFWFKQELQSGGYPLNAEELPEEERIAAFLSAYHKTRNTNMNWVFTQIFKHLYDLDITDANSIRRADKAVRESGAKAGWAQAVADRLNIKRFVTNIQEHAAFQGMREDAIVIPRIDGKIHEWSKTVQQSAEPAQAFEEIKQSIECLLTSYKAKGYPGIMTTLPRYEASANETYRLEDGLRFDQIMMLILDFVCGTAEREGLLVQLFLGVERSWCGTAVPANDPARILKLTALFERYSKCTFELVVASELNNMDVVQAAWNFSNVHVGGMWWFNFRSSTYRQSMQYRLEAISPMKSSLVVSDARCIEWSFGKILLIKRLAAEFLAEQTARGWLDEETALLTAREWLYSSAAARYGLRQDS